MSLRERVSWKELWRWPAAILKETIIFLRLSATGEERGEVKMGLRGEIFSARAVTSKRTYFFNVKENRTGDLFLTLVESKKHGATGFERHQVIVFEEDIDLFKQEFDQAYSFVKKK